jgi:hypothetical protein
VPYSEGEARLRDLFIFDHNSGQTTNEVWSQGGDLRTALGNSLEDLSPAKINGPREEGIFG